MAIVQTQDYVVRLSKLHKNNDSSAEETLGGDTFAEELESIISELVPDKTIIIEVVADRVIK